MELLELCEPLFQYICGIRRFSQTSKLVDAGQIRRKINILLEQMKNSASRSLTLSQNYQKIELPLIFFIDFMLRDRRLSLTPEWADMARDRGELAGDEKFFNMLDEELNDPSPESSQRLSVYYTCLGLGFTGYYTGQPDVIRKLMLKISLRISDFIDADEESLVCPEAYQNIDTRNLVEPPAAKLVGIGILLVGLTLIWFCVYLYQFFNSSRSISDSVNVILKSATSQTIQ